jgi:hypothetical protein
MLKLIEQERPPPCFDDLVNGAAPLRLSRANRVSTAFGLLGRWATRSWLRTGLASPSTQVAYAKLAWEKRSQIIRKTPRFAYPLPPSVKARTLSCLRSACLLQALGRELPFR